MYCKDTLKGQIGGVTLLDRRLDVSLKNIQWYIKMLTNVELLSRTAVSNMAAIHHHHPLHLLT